jgi:hypothetical protein
MYSSENPSNAGMTADDLGVVAREGVFKADLDYE